MIRRPALFACLALAACSRSAEPVEPQDALQGAETEAEAEGDSAPSARVSNLARPQGGLQADVSSLAATRSDLNVRVTDTGTIVDMPADALFAFDSADLSAESESLLARTADLIRAGGPGPVRIVGHTDAMGSDAYNDDLSLRRAQAVADWFGRQVGVRQRAFEVTGRGEKEPVEPNARPDGSDDPQGRAQNRRVEVVIPNRP